MRRKKRLGLRKSRQIATRIKNAPRKSKERLRRERRRQIVVERRAGQVAAGG